MRTGRQLLLVAGLSLMLASCGGGSTPTLIAVRVTPRSITAMAQRFTAVADYDDNSSRTVNAQVNWSNDAYWVRTEVVDGGNVDATCVSPAPMTGPILNLPAPAKITATVTVNGKTFSDWGTLYCQ